jgi:polyphosphate kinase
MDLDFDLASDSDVVNTRRWFMTTRKWIKSYCTTAIYASLRALYSSTRKTQDKIHNKERKTICDIEDMESTKKQHAHPERVPTTSLGHLSRMQQAKTNAKRNLQRILSY